MSQYPFAITLVGGMVDFSDGSSSSLPLRYVDPFSTSVHSLTISSELLVLESGLRFSITILFDAVCCSDLHCAYTWPAKAPRKDSRSDASTNNRPTRFERGGSQRTTGHDGGPQFVQSYSIFETGIGCVVKTDKSSVELREERPSASKKRTDVQELSETELKDDPLSRYETFITDIKQVFKDPPILMQDSAAGTHAPVDPLKDLDLSAGRNHRVPYDFFTDCGPGRLFSLRLPDKLLPSDLEQLREGPFGKIQVLDNQQVRLVIGEAVFDLVSPHPLTFNSDVILLDPRGDEFIRLNCLGHLEQAMVAVPNLDEFVRLGQ